jgi:hypothetical protein
MEDNKMTESKDKKSSAEEKTGKTGFNMNCCDPETMSEMMKKFSGREEGGFDCSSMMQQCCGPREKN